MTDKEKAQAYDEALNWMRTIYPSLSGADKEDAEHFFPDLRESEDERIRKALIDALKVSETIGELKFRLPYPTREECLAYLEKQKEQKPILEVFGFKVGDAVRLKDGDGRKHIIESFEEVEGLHGPNFYHVEFEDNSARSDIYPGEEYPNGYYTQMEKIDDVQKPIKCIDFDNEFENLVSYFIASALNREYEYNKDFVKYAAHSLLRYAEKEQKPSIFPPAWGEVRWNPISSVQQQPVEWSEKDERILKGIIGKIDHDQTYGVSKVEMLSFLKSLRSHWKPTKEQMDALEEMIVLLRNLRRNIDDRKNLETLREQLEKL